MAFTSGTYYEIRSTGNDVNSGGFNFQGATPGTDRTQQDAAHVNIDGATITATVHTTTTQLTLVGYTVSAADIRNTIKIKAGGTSAVTGFYEITAVDVPNNRWTMSSAMGTAGQTICANMGGAWATLTNCQSSGGSLGAAPTVFFKGNFSLAGITVFASGGRYIGYGTSRGDSGQTIWSLTGNRTTSITSGSLIYNIAYNLAGFNHTTAQPHTGTFYVKNCKVYGGGTLSQTPFGTASPMIRIGCSVEGVSAVLAYPCTDGALYIDCVAINCATAFNSAGSTRARFINCIAISCSTYGFSLATDHHAENCVAISCGVGFLLASASVELALIKCLGVSCTTYSFSLGSAPGMIIMDDCASYGAGTAALLNAPYRNNNFLTLTNNPLTNPGGGDYSLNNVALGGAEIRSLSKTFQSLPSTPAYSSCGAIEPDGGGTSGNLGIVGGILGS